MADIGRWDPALTKRVVDALRPLVKLYHRSEVRGLEHIPAGRCLLVGNHSGGLTTPDFVIFAVDYYAKFCFVDEGVTDRSVHGGVVWHQMRITF